MKLRSIVDVRIAPDGRRVAYVVSTPSLPKNEHEAALFVVPAAGGAPTRLGESVRIFNTPMPAAAASLVARRLDSFRCSGFDGADGRRCSRCTHPAAAPRRADRAPEGVFGYEWSPDGKSLAYLTRDPMPADEERQRQDRSFVIRADAPDRATRLVVQPLDGPTAARIAHAADTVRRRVCRGRRTAARSPTPRRRAPDSQRRTRRAIYAVAVAGGDAADDRRSRRHEHRTALLARRPPDRVHLDQRRSRRHGAAQPRRRPRRPARDGAVRTFVLDDAWVNEYRLGARQPARSTLQANDGTFGRGEHMFEQPIVRVSIGRTAAPSASARRQRSTTRISLSRDGRRARLSSRSSARTMGDVVGHRRRERARDEAHRRQPRTARARARRAEADHVAIVRRHGDLGPAADAVRRQPAGAAPAAARLLPRRAERRRHLRALPAVHARACRRSIRIRPRRWPGAGYAVLFPMPRGGAGYGEAGQRAIVNAWGEGDYKDIMAGVDHLIARGIADPDRLGVMGASYGGYMTNWIVTQTGRFKAASAGASISDLADTYYLSDGGEFMVEYFKRPWENRDVVRRALAADVRRTGDDAAADSARRGRSARADRRRVEVLPGAEGDGQDRGARHLPARRPRAVRADAAARADAAEPRVVPEMDSGRIAASTT